MPEHFMLAGRKLLEGLIVYTKLQIKPLKASKSNEEEEVKPRQDYASIRIQEIENELTTNK